MPDFHFLARTAAFGLAIGFLGTLAGGAETAFAVGALVFGFAVTAWATVVLLARPVEGIRHELDLSEEWTEASARQAFSLLAVLGAAVMIGAAFGGALG